jgi:hypothetical protein
MDQSGTETIIELIFKLSGFSTVSQHYRDPVKEIVQKSLIIHTANNVPG